MPKKTIHSQLKMEESSFQIKMIAIPKFNFEVIKPFEAVDPGTDTKNYLDIANSLYYEDAQTVLDIAIEKEHIKIVKYLESLK